MEDRPQRIGRYRLEARVASGGMASVHMGWLYGDAGFGRLVAIKRLHPHLAEQPQFVDMLLDEARLASRVRHPNVVPILDVVREGEHVLLVMEYVLGVSLAELIKLAEADGRPLSPAIVSAIGAGVLAGLHAAHEATDERGRALGIVHRDVSPHNILVGADGVPRLVDFGIAKAVGRLQTTMTGMLKGKLSYMAPEQRRAGAVDRRADLYALALTLREALTGEAPPPVAEGAHPPPTAKTPFEAALNQALHAAPERRVPNAQQMARELAAVVAAASGGELAALVAELAEDLLRARRKLMADVERAATAKPADDHTSRTQLLGPRRYARRLLLGGGVLAAAGVAAAVALRGRGPGAPTAPQTPQTAATQAPHPSTPPLRTLPTATAAQAPQPSPEQAPQPSPEQAPQPPPAKPTVFPTPATPGAPPSSAPTALRPVTPPSGLGSRRAKPSRKTKPKSGAKTTKAACNPPFTVGPDGVKRYKIECLED